MAASALLSMSIIATFSTHTPSWLLWVAIVPSGFGMSGVITSTLIALIACVRKEDIAVATGGTSGSLHLVARTDARRFHSHSLVYVPNYRVCITAAVSEDSSLIVCFCFQTSAWCCAERSFNTISPYQETHRRHQGSPCKRGRYSSSGHKDPQTKYLTLRSLTKSGMRPVTSINSVRRTRL